MPCNVHGPESQSEDFFVWVSSAHIALVINSPDHNPVDYQIWGRLLECNCSVIKDIKQLKSCPIEEWEHFRLDTIIKAVKW